MRIPYTVTKFLKMSVVNIWAIFYFVFLTVCVCQPNIRPMKDTKMNDPKKRVLHSSRPRSNMTVTFLIYIIYVIENDDGGGLYK